MLYPEVPGLAGKKQLGCWHASVEPRVTFILDICKANFHAVMLCERCVFDDVHGKRKEHIFSWPRHFHVMEFESAICFSSGSFFSAKHWNPVSRKELQNRG